MRPILTLLAFALSVLSLSGQTHYLGTGRAMLPTWTHASRLVVYESELTDVRVGDLVARQLGPYLIGTRAMRPTAGGWITRADSASSDDAGTMREDSYLGKVYPDHSRPDGRAATGPIVRDLYVLTPYHAFTAVSDWVPVGRPGTDNPTSSVPDGGVFGAFGLALVALCAARRFFS